MPHLEFLVEEPSMEATLDVLLPPLLTGRATFKVINFDGKDRLLRLLGQRLAGYRHRLEREDIRLVVLVDEDRQDCGALKAAVDRAARESGVFTKSRPRNDGQFRLVGRIVVEELEAWSFGDVEALRAVFPKLPDSLGDRRPYRDPDAIRGGTCEKLHRLLREHGYYPGAFPKLEVARRVAPHLDPGRNRSRSFQVFLTGLEAVLALPGLVSGHDPNSFDGTR